MRFLFYDRIVEMELGKRAVATRSISVADEFLLDHYSRNPLMPATLILESVTQVAGWLYIATKGFAISTVLALAQGVDVVGEGRPGSTLRLESTMLFEHREGATLSGVATCDGQPVLRVERLVFASRPLKVAGDVQRSREFFDYVSGGYRLNGAGHP
jgi:3-hydroxyacyl-[acyl-carrier-protein] dehydratase